MVSMNTTLQEHIKQAIFAVEQEGIILPIVLEKFAQLIVKECINLVNLRQRFAVEDGLNAEHALDILVYDIEQHFGIDG
jgi:hypothetical protein